MDAGLCLVVQSCLPAATPLQCIEGSLFATSSPGEGTPLQYSCLGTPMDGGAWWAAIHGVTKSWTWLRDFTFHFHAWEKEMATHSSDPAWRISGTGEPGGLPSVWSRRVGHDWSDLAAAAAAAAPALPIFCLFESSHSDTCEVTPPCDFEFHFLDN